MALMNCPECNKQISEKARECPYCGYNIKKYLNSMKRRQKVNKKNMFVLIICIFVCIATVGTLLLIGKGSFRTAYNIIKTGSFECIKAHDFETATCQHGQICKNCGSEIGDRVDHKWQEATCQHGKICEYCNLEEGEKTDHKWKEANCTEPKTCMMCGLVNGEPLGHTTRQGYCENCNVYISELQDTYDYLASAIESTWDLIDESMNTMKLTTSFYDTQYVAAANEIDYKIQELLYTAADVAYQYDEFYNIGKDLKMAGAKLYLFDSLTSKSGFGSYTYMTSMVNSLADCATSLGTAQEELNKLAK